VSTLFTPIWFTAHSGTVHFEGRPLSELSSVRAGVAIRRAGLDAPRAHCWAYDVAHEQLFAAQAQAKAQRTTFNPSAAGQCVPSVTVERGGAARPLDREQA